jgi:hypothetical protein
MTGYGRLTSSPSLDDRLHGQGLGQIVGLLVDQGHDISGRWWLPTTSLSIPLQTRGLQCQHCPAADAVALACQSSTQKPCHSAMKQGDSEQLL